MQYHPTDHLLVLPATRRRVNSPLLVFALHGDLMCANVRWNRHPGACRSVRGQRVRRSKDAASDITALRLKLVTDLLEIPLTAGSPFSHVMDRGSATDPVHACDAYHNPTTDLRPIKRTPHRRVARRNLCHTIAPSHCRNGSVTHRRTAQAA